MNTTRVALGILLTMLLALAGCASSPVIQSGNAYFLNEMGGISSSVPDDPFYAWLNDLADSTRADPRYQQIPLGTAARRDAFIGWLHALYRQLITPQQFRQRVLATFPKYGYEVDFIISSLPPVAQRPPG